MFDRNILRLERVETHKGYCCGEQGGSSEQPEARQSKGTGEGRSIFCIIKLAIKLLQEPIIAEVTTHNNHVNHDIIDFS